MVKKFETTYSLHDQPRSGRPSLASGRADKITETTIQLQNENSFGYCSSAQVGEAAGIPHRSVRKILRDTIGMYPYHITTHQAITSNDKITRMQFAKWVLEHQALIPDVLWSDEAIFSLDGVVNRHNCIIWALENPHRTLSVSLHSPKICVWMGFSSTSK